MYHNVSVVTPVCLHDIDDAVKIIQSLFSSIMKELL